MPFLYKELSYNILGAAMEVHNELGCGFLEKVYENALMIAIKEKGIIAKQQYPIKVTYHEKVVGEYFADIFADEEIILELKTVEKITKINKAQTLNYLKATGVKVALIINFKNPKLEYERLVL